MPLLELVNVSKTYGRQRVLDEASFVVPERQKIGVVGRNGAGKTTLFRVMLGEEEADTGVVRRFEGLRLGSIAQFASFEPNESVAQYLQRTSGKPAWEAAKFAAQFAFSPEALERPVAELSGGYQMRARLAAVLLAEPNLLLLDEPTNYLDLNTLLLLEQFLATFRGTLMVISHDREFIKNVCTTTLEVERGRLSYYPGGLEDYYAQKEEQLQWQERHNKKMEAKREHLQSFVDRFRAKASKATQAQSKLKQLARLKAITIDHALPNADIRIPDVHTVPGMALYVSRLAIGYNDKPVVSAIDLDMPRGERVAVLGANGQGKTTFLRTIAGDLSPVSGTCRWWPKADIGYYAQHVQARLNPTQTVLGHLAQEGAGQIHQQDLLAMAGRFLFRGDDLEKPVSVLSGGEKARLCLAGLLLHRYNVLLLDEPTNHLDAETSESLAQALTQYHGTVFFVSHSRTFVNVVATRLLDVRDGRLRQYPGSYEEYVDDLKESLRHETEDAAPDIDKEQRAQERKRVRQEIQELRRRASRIEKRLADIEAERGKLLLFFFENPTDYDPDRRRTLAELEETMRGEEQQWLEVQETIQRYEAEV